MDPGIYMLLVGLFIAVFAVIGFVILAATFRAHDRRRKALHHWEAHSPDSFGHG